MSLLSPPNNPITFVPARAGEIIRLGHSMTGRVMEDGSNTDNRIGTIELTLAPHVSGPVAHWHEMHDETFLITKGTVRFYGAGVKDVEGKTVVEEENENAHGKKEEEDEKDDIHIDVKEGDYIVVGTRAPHTFGNPTGEEVRMVCTMTPAFYVNYFKMMAEMMQGGSMTPEINMEAMASYATIPVQKRK